VPVTENVGISVVGENPEILVVRPVPGIEQRLYFKFAAIEEKEPRALISPMASVALYTQLQNQPPIGSSQLRHWESCSSEK
jgi:hypothetical protein